MAIHPTSSTRQLQDLAYADFAIGYDNERRNPAWVMYELDGPIVNRGPSPTRPATFQTDFATSAHVAHHDYTSSGFDRGHLYPAYAAWSRHGALGFTATFIMSNVVPQRHAVNAGIWESLEENIAGRSNEGGGWAEQLGHLTVINGPVYTAAQPSRLRTGVAIPDLCFSVVLRWDEVASAYRAIAFEIPNHIRTTGPLQRYLTSVRRIELDTGLDLLAGMPTDVRAVIEDTKADAVWAGLNP